MNHPGSVPGWIWGPWQDRPDRKVCFRGIVPLQSGETVSNLEIWADSRYFLWIDGVYIGTGPQRCWPAHPYSDSYDLDAKCRDGFLSLAVLVWHYGTSTSQYIHGPGGLYLSGKICDPEGKTRDFTADETWKVVEHSGYEYPTPRINVSQPWTEIVDSRCFPADWMSPGFDDGSWSQALPAVPQAERLKLNKRTTPLLDSRQIRPNRILQERRIRCRGIGVRIDYKSAFYPSDTSTEDRFQTGYIATVVHSPSDQMASVSLADRLWPEITERILVNGEAWSFQPGVRMVDIPLAAGENLMMLDVSGARQRFTADLHVETSVPIRFLSPEENDEAAFVAVGPFDTLDIGNIVCMDGFEAARPGPEYERAGQARNREELKALPVPVTPVPNVLFDGVKLRSVRASVESADYGNQDPSNLGFPGESNHVDEEVVLDMGGEVSGFLCFRIDAGNDGEFDFRFAENIQDCRLEIPDDLDTSLRFRSGNESTEYRSLLRRGFRYLAVRYRGQGRAVIRNLRVDERLYPSRRRGSFQSSDTKLNEIWQMCRRTVELCSEDTFVDCPAFEQAFWIGDAAVMSLYRQYLFGDTSLNRHCLLLAARSLEHSALPDCHLPAGVSLVLTAWSQLWIIACRDHWMLTDDTEFAREIYPWIRRCLDEFRRHLNDDGLLSISAWNLLDWASLDTPYHGINAHINARHVECLGASGELAEAVGRHRESVELIAEAARLAARSHGAFWDADHRAYRDCIHADGRPSEVFSVQTNLMMILYGCTPEENRNDVHSFIAKPPKDAILPGSPYLAHFFYDYLFARGSDHEAVTGILDQWRPMLDHGTCWETFRGFYKDRLTRSYCHGWSAAPGYLLGKWVLGIQPLEPGFRKIRIAPRTGGLARARGTVPIPRGDVVVSWEADDLVFRYSATVPAGVEWEIEEPRGNWKEIRIDVVPESPEESRR